MNDLTDEQTNLLLACYDLPQPEANFVYGALVRAAVEGHAVTPERLAVLVSEAKAVAS